MPSAARTFAKRLASRHASYVLATSAVMLMLLAFGACGVSSTSLASSGAATPTATTGASGKGTSVKPCPIVGTSVDIASPSLILTPKSANQQATAHVGAVIVVELPATSRWTLNQTASVQLQPSDPQGALDEGLNVCVWAFRAQSAGTASLSFTGSAVCENGQECPQFALPLSFTISID